VRSAKGARRRRVGPLAQLGEIHFLPSGPEAKSLRTKEESSPQQMLREKLAKQRALQDLNWPLLKRLTTG
jgi:hypothetical protein